MVSLWMLLLALPAVVLAVKHQPVQNIESNETDLESNRISNSTNGVAVCRDPDLSRFMNTAMAGYIHNMDGLSRSIMDQITAYRKPGKWLVHAQVISGSSQGRDWQTSTNSDIFGGRNLYGCFYHDAQTYILVLRVYA